MAQKTNKFETPLTLSEQEQKSVSDEEESLVSPDKGIRDADLPIEKAEVSGELTSLQEQAERKDAKASRRTDQAVAQNRQQQNDDDTDNTNLAYDDDDNPETAPMNAQSVFNHVVNTVIGYRIATDAVRNHKDLAKGSPHESETWIGAFVEMVGKKVDRLVR
jgi:hypothetical protein